MSMRINGFRASVLATLLAITGVNCKRVPYKPMPENQITPRMTQVVDSFCNEGLKIKHSAEYRLVKRDTIRFYDSYIENPQKLAKHLHHMSYEDSHVYDDNGVEHKVSGFIKPEYVVSSKQIFTKDGERAYIAVEEYDKIHK